MADPDYLAPLSPSAVAAFYRRLAASIQAQVGGDSLAAMLLLWWLDGKSKPKVFDAKYVRDLEEVRSYLQTTARPIFLSQKLTPARVIGGVVPRIRGTIKSNPPGGPYTMHLEGNVETPLTIGAEALMGMKVEARELDALYALHGFTLVSDVVVSVTPKSSSGYTVKFDSWTCKTMDEYHWNPDKHIKVPNPDYGSKDKDAVRPDDQKIIIYHSNAIRVEKANLANPFHNESKPWDEIGTAVVADGFVPI